MSLNILITGSEGYLGQRLTERLAPEHTVFGIDIRPHGGPHYHYQQMDIRDPKLAQLIRTHKITHVIHLASVMQASDDHERDYDIDVGGTQNLLQACVGSDVTHITVTSSGAAYGYHKDNPSWLKETHPLRGNDSFAYSRHKRLVEELLQGYRERHPELHQLILRPGTVLGVTTANQITHLFRKKSILSIKGSDSPFVFIWDEDVVDIVVKGVLEHRSGIYNLAGDGALTVTQIAELLNKPTLTLPAWLLQSALWIGYRLGLSRYSADQLKFLRYRPVLDNHALKHEFGYTPKKSSREVFEYYLSHNEEMRG
ncbi:SDR family oxidoreductase [Pseudoalteromonas sp. YIC-656]|uniref:SDR family oxidoreductase n=1 Tax=Pseudoalteromonas pernae TaxID=3118054 RepID=UPI003242B17C